MAAMQSSLGSRIVLLARVCAPGVALSTCALALRWAVTRLLTRLQKPRQLPAPRPKKEKPSGSLDPLWESCGFSAEVVDRFGRQIILPKVGPAGQRAIMDSSVLIVGAGGLGCPVALYLCGAGIGRMGIVDDDGVAVSNLHRQIGHSCQNVGENKAASLRRACLAINDDANIEVHAKRLRSLSEAVELFSGYDLVVDCTDAPASRYLLSDAAVVAGRPLVAPSAVSLSGQLSVYNWQGGPCLRCIFPDIPSADAAEPVASCAESGVLGPVPGILGTLAALEALKVIVGGSLGKSCLNGRMLLYDAQEPSQPFRSMRISKREGCRSCGQDSVVANDANYDSKCCIASAPCSADGSDPNILAAEVAADLRSGKQMIVIDVRHPSHFAVSHLAASENWPLPELLRSDSARLQTRMSTLKCTTEKMDTAEAQDEPRIVCVCRRGNDSMRATLHLKRAGLNAWNLQDGLQALAMVVEPPLEVPPLT